MTQTETIEKFYSAFQKLDVETMVSLYHDDIEFTDPGFGTLLGVDAKNMWRMICSRAKDFSLEYSQVTENSAHWNTTYTFSASGRTVHNSINATFEFKDGKISKHIDLFDLHKWATQALGFKGKLFGGTSFFKKKLHKQTTSLLAAYTNKHQ